MEILYNNEGTPLLMNSTLFYGETTSDKTAIEERRQVLFPFDKEHHREYIDVNGKKVICWGPDNQFPYHAIRIVRDTTVLNAGLKFLWRLTIGQGIYACEVTGYNEHGDETLAPIKDKEIQEFVNSRMVRRYMEKVLRDYLKVGNGAVQFVPNLKGEYIGMNPLNCIHYRYTEPNEKGESECCISGSWDYAPNDTIEAKFIDLLSDYNPDDVAEYNKFKGKHGFVYSVRDAWSNEDIYGEPIWWAAWVLGWVDISHMIPRFLKKAYKNQTTWKWHVQIPYSYWDKKFPVADFKTSKEREEAINKYMDSIERNLLGPENAEKPIFTNYAVNEYNGRVEEEWKITPLSNKYNAGQENLVTSSAANSEILFALMLNPNVMGSQMPGGVYAGNQGGSNIREAFLVNIANAWIDRQNILDPIKLFIWLRYKKRVELRFRNTILTTLDTGAGTAHRLS